MPARASTHVDGSVNPGGLFNFAGPGAVLEAAEVARLVDNITPARGYDCGRLKLHCSDKINRAVQARES
jgi:hypothetical protein